MDFQGERMKCKQDNKTKCVLAIYIDKKKKKKIIVKSF